jgi:pimeloyl-ACP methyl ester carboxylesterase
MIYILIPGEWAGGWVWDSIAARLRRSGQSVHQLTLPGLENGEDAGEVHLTTHVNAVIDYLESRELNDVVLVGHSYSGIVVGQVSSRLQNRVAHSVFIEAFLPVDGKSLLEVSGLDVAHEKGLIDENGGLWPAPTLEELKSQPHLSDELVKLLVLKLKDHPGKTVTDPAAIVAPLANLRSTFISDDGWLNSSREADLVQTLQKTDNWSFKTIEGGHWPMLTIPDELATLLRGLST